VAGRSAKHAGAPAATGRTLALVAAVLWFAVLASAMTAVWARHEARERFRELQALERERDELDITWSQLRLELGTLSMHARVEQLAREKLSMRAPDADEMMTVTDRD
jgi:cell division protein FtsL